MKFLLTCIVLTSVAFSITNAQLIDSIYPEMNPRTWNPWKSIRSLHPIDDTSFVVQCNSGKVYAMHINGHRLWESQILDFQWAQYMHGGWIAGNNPQRLIMTYIEDDCDTWGYSNHTILNLETRGLNRVPARFSNHEFAFPFLPGLPKYLFFSDTSYSLYYSADSIITKQMFSEIKLMDINRHGDFVFLTKDSILFFKYHLGEFKLEKNTSHNLSGGIYRIHFATDSTFMIHIKNEVLLFDHNLQFAKKSTLTHHPYESDMARRNWDEPFLIIIDRPGDSTDLLVFDQFLNLVFKTPYSFSDRRVADAIYTGDSTFILTGDMYNTTDRVTYLKNYDFSVIAENPKTDIALTSVRHDKLTFLRPSDCIMGGLLDYEIKEIEIDLTNTGNTIIDQVIIASEFSFCTFYCWPEQVNHDTLKQIHLLPGETQTFHIGTRIVLDQEYDREDGVCLYALLPDNQFDFNGSNDFYCVFETVGTIEISKDLSIYPNPVHDFLNFNIPQQVKRASVFNVNGMKVIEHLSSDSGIEIGHLQPGLYILQADGSDGTNYSGRFVKL